MSSGPMETTQTPEPTIEQRFAQLQAQLVAVAMVQGNTSTEEKGFPDAPIFDGEKPEELRTWIIQLRNKLASQP